MQEHGPKSTVNLYRKQFGNIKQPFHTGEFKGIFKLDGSIIVLEERKNLEEALKSSKISESDMLLVQNIYRHAFGK